MGGVIVSSCVRAGTRSLPAKVTAAGLLIACIALPDRALTQTAVTLDEVTVQSAAPTPSAPRPAPAASSATTTSVTQPAPMPALSVVSTTPITGLGFDRDKVPALVQTLTAEDFTRANSPSVLDALQQRIPGVVTTDVQGNSLFPDFRYRGFAASPLQGTPQGIAVYMNGIRINEAFGDTVNWDMIPTVAIGRADVWTNNPAFGLNAIGGAVSLQMKDGFTYQGTEIDVSGGSFGRFGGSVQYGGRKDEWALYLAATGLKDDGWRYQSPARIARFYGDLGRKTMDSEIHLVASAANNYFGVIGPTPVDLLARDYRSIYTWPQTTKNEAQLVALNGRFSLTDHLTLQANLYLRHFKQGHVDGNTADVENCGNDTLCLADDAFPGLTVAERQLRTQSGGVVNCAGPGADPCSQPFGTIDRTLTKAWTVGGSLQTTNDAKIFGHDNYFTLGASVDHSKIDFEGSSQLGYIFPNFFVGPNLASSPESGSIIHTDSYIGYAPVVLGARSTYFGMYLNDTFDITTRLSVTAGARYNVAMIEMADLLGTSPDLNGAYTFSRLNPVVGLTYKMLPAATFYAGYSEANRAPTPLELGCSNPQRPCLLEGFLVSDPPLQQVVAHTYEAGLRGNVKVENGKIDWKFGLFRTDSSNDIIHVASSIQGRGVYQNVGGTRRQGIEASAEYRSRDWLAYASYALVDATYQFTGSIASPNNPLVTPDNPNILVTPGKQIPGIPRHLVKFGADYAVTPQWKVGGDVIWVGSQWYVGDDANWNVKVADYWVANLHTSYQINKQVQIYGLVNNLFNRHYAAFGTYFDPRGASLVIPNPPTDHRTNTPGQPLSLYVGMRARL
jgi:iron complex outermembrane receptor protein